MKASAVILLLLVASSAAWGDTLTIGTNGSAYSTEYTGTVTTWAPTNSVFTYYALPVTWTGSTLYATGIDSSYAQSLQPPVQVRFKLVNASNLEFNITGFNLTNAYRTPYFSISDGTTNTPITNSPVYVRNNGNTYFTRINFGTTNEHDITFWLSGGLAGVNTTNGTLLPWVPTNKPNLLIISGDSYTQGYLPDGSAGMYPSGPSWFYGYGQQCVSSNADTFAMLLGISGTGYYHTNGSTGDLPYRFAMTNNCLLASNAVVSGKYSHVWYCLAGTINDWDDVSATPSLTNAVFQAATNVMGYTRQQLSDPSLTNKLSLFAIGNWCGVGGESVPGTGDYNLEWAMTNAAVQEGWLIYDPIPTTLRTVGNYSTFFPSSPAGVSDSVHPSIAGYQIYATWLNTNLVNTFGATWTTPSDGSGSGGGGTTNAATLFLWL